MFIVNTSSKRFTESASLDLGLLPADGKIDIQLTDGTNPVIAENKTFSMTIGTVLGSLYKTDNDTVSFRYLKFNDDNIADSLVITMTMDGVEILNDTVSLTYQTSGGIDASALDKKLDAPATPGTVGQVLTKTADGQEWDDLPDENGYLCFTATQANNTVRLNKIGTPEAINLEYSTDKKTWTEYTWDGNNGATITLANIWDKVWWRGNNNTFSINTENYYRFAIPGNIEASGNIMSLLDKTCKSVTIPTPYCFCMLFQNCEFLETPPELPATTLADYCYYAMFQGCGMLRNGPKLPALIMVHSCYRKMFTGCTYLMTPPELPAIALADYCYCAMFQGCSSFTKAPELPATRLADYCYSNMFRGCMSLNRVKVPFKSWGNNPDWLTYASTTCVFECPSALDCSIRDGSHVPAGWTIVRTDAPKSITSPTSASSEATYEVSPNTPSVPVVTVASALTLNASTIDNESVTYAEIVLDVATGATVTAGTNLTLVDTPTAGKRNICVCRWSGGVCKLYVTIVEDLPQA